MGWKNDTRESYSIIPEKGKYTAVPKGYDTSYKTMDSPDMSNYERWESLSDVGQGLSNILTGTAEGFGYDLSDPQSLAESLALSLFIPGPLKNVAKKIKSGAKTARKSVTPSGRKQLREDAKKKIIDIEKAKVGKKGALTKMETNLINEKIQNQLGPTLKQRVTGAPGAVKKKISDAFNPKVRPFKKAALTGLSARTLGEQYSQGAGPGQENWNPYSSLLYAPIPLMRGFSPATWLGGQHLYSDLFGSDSTPVDMGSTYESSPSTYERIPMIDRPGSRAFVDSLFNAKDYTNLRNLSKKDKSLKKYIDSKIGYK